MVKAHIPKAPQGGKDTTTTKKKTSSKKKSIEAGAWPCKMAGCSKVFAREADLKRHQRTTKLHTAPGFQCPQCDATFTRTDALRRHQKSRHNGVVIETQDASRSNQEPAEGEAGPSGSQSSSRSGSPAGSNDDRASDESNSSPVASTSNLASGPSSYYRPHTMHIGYPPRPPPMMIDPNYPPPVAIPTSAARLQHPGWHPPPAGWASDGTPLPPGPVYSMSPYYPQPSPYYRHHVMPSMPHPMHPSMYPEYVTHHYPPPMHSGGPMPYGIPHPPLSAVTGVAPPPPQSDGGSSTRSSPSRTDEGGPEEDTTNHPTSGDAFATSQSNGLVQKDVVDATPSESSTDNMNQTAANILEATVKALLQKGAEQVSNPPADGSLQRLSHQEATSMLEASMKTAKGIEQEPQPPEPDSSNSVGDGGLGDQDAEGEADTDTIPNEGVSVSMAALPLQTNVIWASTSINPEANVIPTPAAS
ncbi:unnamed protein product [Somion occarium]|uniref:C2H2-type domain-containing protein n=1 Tax=Somion occarium TaxID=3059160 RepID=A0ABP1CEI5_9APHY